MPADRRTAWQNFPDGVIGAVLGALPLFFLLARGRRQAALANAGAFALGAALLAHWWTSNAQWLAWSILASAWIFGMASEAHVRLNAVEPARTIASVGFSIFVGGIARSTALAVLWSFYPAIDVGPMLGHSAGRYFLQPLPAPEYAVGDLVAYRENGVDLLGAGGYVAIAPIIAGPGQEVVHRGREIFVDDSESPEVGAAQVIMPSTTLRRLEVAPEQVALFEVPLRSRNPAMLLGRVAYQWTPVAERGPVRWPPAEDSR